MVKSVKVNLIPTQNTQVTHQTHTLRTHHARITHMSRTSYALTVKELDDICEVHVIIDDDLSVILDERESDEENEVRRADVLSNPDALPHQKHVLVQQLWK